MSNLLQKNYLAFGGNELLAYYDWCSDIDSAYIRDLSAYIRDLSAYIRDLSAYIRDISAYIRDLLLL